MTTPPLELPGRLMFLDSALASIKAGWGQLPLDPGLAEGLTRPVAPTLVASTCFSEAGPSSFAGLLDLLEASRDTLRCLPREYQGGWEEQTAVALQAMEQEAGRQWRAQLALRLQGLYFIIDPQVTGGREPLEVAESALLGGARVVQLRDKLRDKGMILPLARSLHDLCRKHDALLIVNDHADVAKLAGADGLHVGQTDLPVADARRVLEPWQLLGRSNPSPEYARDSAAQGADHVAIGPIYPTGTKSTGRAPVGCEPIRRIKQTMQVRVVAIGGINEDNVAAVVEAGADAVCVSSAVGLASDPEEAARRLVHRMSEAGAAL